MADEYGIKETVDLFRAAGDVAVVVYKAQAAARGPDGKIDAQKLGTALAAAVMSNPQVIEDVKAAAEGIGDVPKEIKDLSLGEIFTLLGEAGKIAAACSEQIKAT